MDELSADARRLLSEALSSEERLGARHRQELWLGIGQRLAAPNVALTDPRSGPVPTKALPFVKGAAVLGVLGALVWAGNAALGGDSSASLQPPHPAPLKAVVLPQQRPSETPLPQPISPLKEAEEPEAPAATPPAPVKPRVTSNPQRAAEKTVRAAASANVPPPSTPTPEAVVLEDAPASRSPSRETLREELALLNRSYALLDAGQPTEALALLAEHRRKFATPVLAEEALAARTIAECRLARTLDVRKARAAAFLARGKNSPLADRVRGACGSNR